MIYVRRIIKKIVEKIHSTGDIVWNKKDEKKVFDNDIALQYYDLMLFIGQFTLSKIHI